MSVESNNKRIAKNSLLLYLRMFIIMLVGLYTSRMVLQTLGINDFGIYNIVGGVVVLFTFINSAMTTGTQRHLSYELGKENGDIGKIYTICLNIHLLISLIFLVLAETIGLWFVNTQLNLPADRMEAVNWIYQFSVLSCLIGIIRVPDNALIISNEKMVFFAYISILESIFKLIIVYALLIFNCDKLILYSILLTIVTFAINIAYRIYCVQNFPYAKWKKAGNNKDKYKEILSFSGWTMFGSIANVALQQGTNIIINIFYGVTLNAAIGIANQVNSQISTFVNGFQQALNPQLTIAQAENNRIRQNSLICSSAKFSCYIMMIVAIPIIINLRYILTLWLGEYPEHTISICTLIIIDAILGTLSNPLWVTIFATGYIKKYQMVTSFLLLLNIPFSYIGGIFNVSPEMMYIIRIAINMICLVVRLHFLQTLISFKIAFFSHKVLLPIFLVSVLIILPITILPSKILTAQNLTDFLIISSIIIIYNILAISGIGLTKEERIYIKKIIKQLLRRKI